MISVLIVDDHFLIREGLKKILTIDPDLVLAGECNKAADAIEFILHHDCHVVILDLNLPDRSGLDALKDILAIKPGMHVLILSILPEDLYAERAIRAGASGYITKESPPEEFIKAIRKVVSGRKYISENLSERLASRLSDSDGVLLHDRLTDREFQVLMLLGSGKNTAQTAAALNINQNTVNTYKFRIFRKMQFRDLSDIIRYVLQQDLLKSNPL